MKVFLNILTDDNISISYNTEQVSLNKPKGITSSIASEVVDLIKSTHEYATDTIGASPSITLTKLQSGLETYLLDEKRAAVNFRFEID
jgi:hypothetical protein